MAWTFVAIVLLRLAIGFHFFREGTAKLNTDWTAKYFLSAAKGPLAPLYHYVLDDPDGKIRLCVKENQENGTVEFDPTVTVELFRDFVDRAKNVYRFGDVELLRELTDRRDTRGVQIRRAREAGDRSVDTRELERLRAEDESHILTVRKQQERADEILESHIEQLTDWLAINETELRKHFSTEDRLDGFDRDGENRDKVATYVPSIRGQVDTIRSDRQKQLNGWIAQIDAIYNSLEAQINGLAVDKQSERPYQEVHRPFKRENSYLSWIDRIVPWFDTIVGVLLILGLFTRVAALAGALFLLSVCLSQPFWIPGTQDTMYQAIEMFGLFTLFAICGGRFGGLDYFLTSPSRPENESSDA